MNAAVADRVAELEAERCRLTPRRPVKPVGPPSVSAADQARHRAELLAALRKSARPARKDRP